MILFNMPQVQNDIIEILVSFAIVDTNVIPTKEDGTVNITMYC